LAKEAELKGLGLLTATSCNRSGDPAARTRGEAQAVCAKAAKDFKVRLVKGLTPDATGLQPSTVLDATCSELRILREGAIKREAIFRAIDGSYIS
jgi:tRNA A37 threonylcarbamoyladenosine synthetase subunit TsaC/SUA5/YrdC